MVMMWMMRESGGGVGRARVGENLLVIANSIIASMLLVLSGISGWRHWHLSASHSQSQPCENPPRAAMRDDVALAHFGLLLALFPHWHPVKVDLHPERRDC